MIHLSLYIHTHTHTILSPHNTPTTTITKQEQKEKKKPLICFPSFSLIFEEMMDSKMFLSLFLLTSSWVSLGFSLNPLLLNAAVGVGGGGGGDTLPPCVPKLLPCQAYLAAGDTTSPPPVSCCLPLKELMANDQTCLCEVANNADLLKGFNLTQEVIMKLPKACGSNADMSVCKKDSAAPSGSPATPTPATPSNSSSESNTTSPKSAANGKKIAYFGGSCVIIFILNLIL